MVRKLLKNSLLFLVATLLTSCVCSRADPFFLPDKFLRQGEPEKAVAAAIQLRETCPKKDRVGVLAKEGIAHFYNNCPEMAVPCLDKALDLANYYLQESDPEKASILFLSEKQKSLTGDPFEEILLRSYFAFSLFSLGDEENGLAILRQAERREQEIAYEFPKMPSSKNWLNKYLLALFLEQQGDFSNAKILFQQIEKSCPLPIQETMEKEEGTLVVVVHKGFVPFKVPGRAPLSEEALFILESALCDKKHPMPICSLPPVEVSFLAHPYFDEPRSLDLFMNGKKMPLFPLLDTRKEAFHAWNTLFPLEVARAYFRVLSRRGLVSYAAKQDPLLGTIADIAAFISNLATKADLRSISTMPAIFEVTKKNVPPGIYTLTAITTSEKTVCQVEVKKDTISLVHLVSPPFGFLYWVK